MNLKTFNESFRKYYTEDIDDAIQESFETDLRTALIDKAERLGRSGPTSLKRYEIEFQDTIETLVPEKSWWEVTDCEIFNVLFYKICKFCFFKFVQTSVFEKIF